MSYATVDDVQRRMPQFTLTPTTKPSVETAQVLLDDTHAQFDSAVEGMGYVVPITGAKSIAQAREIVSICTIAKVLFARGAAVGTDAAFQTAEKAQARCDQMMAALADEENPLTLSDAEITAGFQEKQGFTPMGLHPTEPRVWMKKIY
jgi:hypothetical protein